jgi:hypothetical protein
MDLRKDDGGRPYVARNASLNRRTLRNPAAKAMSDSVGSQPFLKKEAGFDFVGWHHCIGAEWIAWPKPCTLIEADGLLLTGAGFEAQHRRADRTSFVLDPPQQSLR